MELDNSSINHLSPSAAGPFTGTSNQSADSSSNNNLINNSNRQSMSFNVRDTTVVPFVRHSFLSLEPSAASSPHNNNAFSNNNAASAAAASSGDQSFNHTVQKRFFTYSSNNNSNNSNNSGGGVSNNGKKSLHKPIADLSLRSLRFAPHIIINNEHAESDSRCKSFVGGMFDATYAAKFALLYGTYLDPIYSSALMLSKPKEGLPFHSITSFTFKIFD